MRHAYCAFRLVDVLTACAATSIGIHFDVVFVEIHFNVLRFGEHRNGDRRRMHSALRFGFGNALHSVHAAFELKFAPCAFTRYHENEFLCSAEFGEIHIDFFHFPAIVFGIMTIHLHEFSAEKCRFVSARARAYFHNNVVVFVRVFRKKCDFQIRAVLFHIFAQIVKFLLFKCFHVLIALNGNHLFEIVKVALMFQIPVEYLHDRFEIAVFF